MSKTTAIIALLIALAGGLAIGRLTSSSGDEDDLEEGVVAADEGVERFKVPVTDAQPVKGPKDAPVTIVEFSDFECPYCSRVEPTVNQVQKTYGNKVRIVWRNNPLPFHQNAGPAANLASEAFAQGGSQKFWKVHGLLFANQKALTRADLEKYAGQAGLDVGKVKAALDGNKYQSAIAADQELATKLDARGTPAFFINGRKLMGAQPFEEFKKVIDEEIKTAEKLEDKGVKGSAIYAALMKDAKEKAEAPPQQEPEARKEPDPKAVYRVPVGNAPQKGPNDALVTIVQFSDFECPFCSRVEPTINDVVKKYGKEVRVVWKNNPLPFHSSAMPAAEAASEAFAQKGSAGFWKMHELMFKNQKALGRDQLTVYAKEAGLNVAKFNKALDDHTHKAAIEADMKLASDLGASGTPSFFINGRNLRGAQPLPAFTALIDEEIKKAEEKVKAGTPKAKLYEAIIASGATTPQTIAPSKGAEPEEDDKKIYTIAVPAKAPTKGAKGAKVVIQLFSDFQCPFCSRAVPTVAQIEKEYANKVRVIWRNYPLPFHENATPAAEAAMEVYAQKGDAGFWKMHDLLFANQQALSRADLEKYAAQVGGVNMDTFKKAMDEHTHKAAVQADMDAVTKAGAQIGTPSFFINGKLVQGAVPFEVLKKEIDAALASK